MQLDFFSTTVSGIVVGIVVALIMLIAKKLSERPIYSEDLENEAKELREIIINTKKECRIEVQKELDAIEKEVNKMAAEIKEVAKNTYTIGQLDQTFLRHEERSNALQLQVKELSNSIRGINEKLDSSFRDLHNKIDRLLLR